MEQIYLLDTDMLSLLQYEHPVVVAAIQSHESGRIALTTPTIEEQISGWSALARSARTSEAEIRSSTLLSLLVSSWKRFGVEPMSQASVTRFGSLVSLKLNVRHNDLRIVAIGLVLGATVVTRNRRDFGRVPGLAIEDWSI